MKLLPIILIFLSHFGVVGQMNLVPNPSFEDTTYCPSVFSNLAGGGVLLDWYNPNTASPDYYNACSYAPLVNQNIPDGQAFVGMSVYSILEWDLREYVQCELLDTLESSKIYLVSFSASLGELMSMYACNNLGVHLSDTAIVTDNVNVFNVATDVLNFNNEIIADTSDWVLIRGLYDAHGGERFLTIGNFVTDAETIQGPIFADGQGDQAYYYIDNVSVIPLDSIPGGLPVDAGPDQTIYIGDTAFIGQKISNMPANWYVLNGAQVASGTAGLYVWPEETTTYVVTQTLNGVFSSDTVTVFVEGIGLTETSIPAFTIAPNPSAGTCYLYLEKPLQQPVQMVLYDNTGRKVQEQTTTDQGNVLVLTTTVQPGVYFLELRQNGVAGGWQRLVME